MRDSAARNGQTPHERPRLPLLRALAAVVLVLTLGAIGASPAVGANQTVQAVDIAYIPSAVAVKPGETVTWTHPATAEPHNVKFDDLTYPIFTPPATAPRREPWTAFRTFTTEGAYRYFCEEHGSPGGVGMSGVVFVNPEGVLPAGAPTASFTVVGNPVAGQLVNLDARASSDTGGTIVRYEWDFDGDGFYETETTSVSPRAFATPGARVVKLRVTDNQGLTGETQQTIVVTSAPVASFTASPNPSLVGQAVTFNAAGSSDADGPITNYEWDLDGNGSYETTTATPTVSRAYTGPGEYTVKLRVTDSSGTKAETTRSLRVNTRVVVLPPPTTGGLPPPPAQPAALVPVSSTIKILSSKRLKKVLRRGLRFEAGVPSSGAGLRATLSARGRKLGTLRRSGLSRGRVTLTIKLSKKGKASLKKLLARRRKVGAQLKVTAGTTTTRAKVTLSR